jgi:hypothetical protein
VGKAVCFFLGLRSSWRSILFAKVCVMLEVDAVIVTAKIIYQVVQRSLVAVGYTLKSHSLCCIEIEGGLTEITFRFVVKRDWR